MISGRELRSHMPVQCGRKKKKKKKLKKVKRLYIETSLSRNSRERNEIVAEGERVLGKGFFISLRRKK